MRFNHVLVAVDGSEGSDLALEMAIGAAERDNSALTLIHVAPDTAGWPFVPPMQDEVDEAARRTLARAVALVPAEIPVTTILRHGKAGCQIVAYAHEHPVDAIILGARGVGRVGALVGSVSAYVLHHARTAVFVAHPSVDEDARVEDPARVDGGLRAP